ncbi:MAG: helix-turn-helix transcriptional regulator [Oscillospiraceae bacterium]|nr:helix-turn-helix transcriptional regulator [Oscillospiraceae bacterium]
MQKNETISRLRLTEETGEVGVSINRQKLCGYQQHWHDYYEIEVVTEGKGTFYCNGTEYTYEKGRISLLTPADFHNMRSDEVVKITNIEVGPEWFSESMRKMMSSPSFMKSRKLSEEDLNNVIAALDLLENEYERKGPCIQQILEYIFSRFALGGSNKPASSANKEYTKGIMKAVTYIEQHFRERITLETLSQVSGYHPTYFSKMFNQVTGETYIERVTSLRMNYAKMLLRKGASVSEARVAAGFGSHSNFTAAFKKRCGMSPSEYRAEVREIQKENQKKP